MVGTAPVSTRSAAQGRFACAKVNRRLFIQDTETGALLYTHPDFVRLINRDLMARLASAARLRGHLDISDIMLFEARAPRAGGYRTRATSMDAMNAISAYVFDRVSGKELP